MRSKTLAIFLGATAVGVLVVTAVTFAGIKLAVRDYERQIAAWRNETAAPYEWRMAALELTPDEDIKASDEGNLNYVAGMACLSVPKGAFDAANRVLAWDRWLEWWAAKIGPSDDSALMAVVANQRAMVEGESPSAQAASCNKATRRAAIAYQRANPPPPYTPPWSPPIATCPPFNPTESAYCSAYRGAKDGMEAALSEHPARDSTP